MDIKYAGKVTIPHLIESIKSLFVKKEDIVDNLISTDTTAPLSANQGYILNERIDTTNELLESKAEETIAVTIDENGESSHSSYEIFAHVNEGGNVVLDHAAYGRMHIQGLTETGVLFVGYLPLSLNNEIISAAIYIQDNSVADLTESVKPISSPESATAGQFIKVLEVDDAGNVIATEAVDEPDEDDALELVAELGLAEPMTDDEGNVLTDENGVLFLL